MPGSLALIEIAREDIATLPELLRLLRGERRRVLYSEEFGHSEWVTGVTYCGDGSGRVASCGMDGKVCLWADGGGAHGGAPQARQTSREAKLTSPQLAQRQSPGRRERPSVAIDSGGGAAAAGAPAPSSPPPPPPPSSSSSSSSSSIAAAAPASAAPSEEDAAAPPPPLALLL